jgi:hypothetical protein
MVGYFEKPPQRLVRHPKGRILDLMAKVWKVITSTKRMGGGGPPLKEYFLVAIAERNAALAALRDRRPDVAESELSIVGEASPDYVEWLDVKDGDILCVLAVS